MKMQRYNKCFAFIIIVALLSTLTSCAFYRHMDKTFLYDDGYILGKTSAEIQDKYGVFDLMEAEFNEDGLYCDGWCRYLTAKGINDIDLYMLIAPTYDEYYSIHFDENGVADKIEMRVNIKGSQLIILFAGATSKFWQKEWFHWQLG